MKISRVIGIGALGVLALGSLGAVSPAVQPAIAGECCRCVIAIPPEGGNPYQGCKCEFTSGGLGCNITPGSCVTYGTCTSGG